MESRICSPVLCQTNGLGSLLWLLRKDEIAFFSSLVERCTPRRSCFSVRAANHLFLSATATTADLERVFTTRLGMYEVDKGEFRRAPIEPGRVPAALASRVSAVLGLATERAKPTALHSRARNLSAQNPPPGITCVDISGEPTSDYYGQYFNSTETPYGGGFPNPTPLRQCALTPSQLRRAYGFDDPVAAGHDGRHIRIAIVDAYRQPTPTPSEQQRP
jgi:subtilase family serine protease